MLKCELRRERVNDERERKRKELNKEKKTKDSMRYR